MRENEEGQTAVEYALLMVGSVALLIELTILMLNATAGFYTDVTRLICLPLP